MIFLKNCQAGKKSKIGFGNFSQQVTNQFFLENFGNFQNFLIFSYFLASDRRRMAPVASVSQRISSKNRFCNFFTTNKKAIFLKRYSNKFWPRNNPWSLNKAFRRNSNSLVGYFGGVLSR